MTCFEADFLLLLLLLQPSKCSISALTATDGSAREGGGGTNLWGPEIRSKKSLILFMRLVAILAKMVAALIHFVRRPTREQ